MNTPPPSEKEPSLTGNVFDWLADLANYLDAHIEAVLVAWREAVDNDHRLETASELSKVEFEDSISVSLQLLSQQLRNRQGFTQDGSADRNADSNWADRKESTLAHEHGFHRWQEGYDIQEVMFEWGHLHLCVVKVFNDYESEHPQVDRYAINYGRLAMAQLMNGGFTQSVAEYHRLQQTEAKEIVHSLSEALDQVTLWERQRGEVLREAIHDLRGNLTAVQAATSILGAASDGTSTTQSSIHSILQRSTKTLQGMLTDLLDLARLEAGQEERELLPTDAAHLLRELCESNQPLAQTKGLYLRWNGPETLPVETDAIKLRRIAQNLLLNAIKYTTQGGISIDWSECEPERWSLSIVDTGPGLPAPQQEPTLLQSMAEEGPPENVPEVAGAPAQPKDSHASGASFGGEGVGLAIVKRLCTLLDAQVEVESRAGAGTTFRLTLPRSYGAA